MPNTPAQVNDILLFLDVPVLFKLLLIYDELQQIGRGVTVWCCTPNLSVEEREGITTVLNSFGKSVRWQI